MTARAAARPRGGRALAAVTAAVATVLGLVAAPTVAVLASVVAGVATAPAARAAEEASLPVTVRLDAVAPQVLEPGQDLLVRATVRNDSDEDLDSPRVSLLLSRFRMAGADEVAAWADAGPTESAGQRVAQTVVEGTLAPGASATVDLPLPAADVRLLDLPDVWGPRGLAVDVTVGRTLVGLVRTYVLWRPAGTLPQARVAVLLPLTAPASVALPAGTAEPLAAPVATAGAGDATAGATDDATDDATADPAGPATDGAADAPGEVVAAEPGEDGTDGSSDGGSGSGTGSGTAGDEGSGADGTTPSPSDLGDATADALALGAGRDVTYAVDPVLVGAAGAGAGRGAEGDGADADGPGGGPLAGVEGHEVWTLPWADPDVAAVARAGRGELLAAAQDLAATTDLATQGPLVWSADPLDATTQDLLGSGAWTAAGPAGARLVVAPPAPVAVTGAGSDGAALRSVTTAGAPLTVVGPDPVLSDLLAGAGTDPDDAPLTPAAAAQRALAETAVRARAATEAGRGVLVAPDRAAAVDPALAGPLLDALAAAPWVTTTPLSGLVDGARDEAAATPAPAPSGTRADPAPTASSSAPARDLSAGAAPAAQVRALADARAATVAFAGVAADPAVLLDGVDAAALSPLSVAWRSDPEGREAAVATVVDALAARRGGLDLAPVSTVNVIAAEAPYRFSVRSSLPTDATVLLRVEPATACLGVGDVPAVTVPAGGEITVPVPFEARANCDVRVTAVLTGADGEPVSAPVTFEARLSPTIESVGTAVVGAVLAVGLVVGVVRTVRRGQGASRGLGRRGGTATTTPPAGGAA
ncbi:DUF6049 family protein [Cellulomonas endophytica]|uniref:DUF6049 family protein n=1 Tax=Cellulomonas endophytica TaxID=2494735 RepID=UPI00101118F8|nr:DUF6049 family protein [Cellulomonas endophytica]